MRPAGAWIMFILYTSVLLQNSHLIFYFPLPPFTFWTQSPQSQVGLVSRLFRQHRFATRQAQQQTSSVSFINMVIMMMIVLFDVRCINIAAWQRLVLSLLCLCWLGPSLCRMATVSLYCASKTALQIILSFWWSITNTNSQQISQDRPCSY